MFQSIPLWRKFFRDSHDPTRIICSGHDSTFTPEGKPTGGPARRSLVRFGISLDANGHVLVDRFVEYPEKQWNDKASFVPVK